MWRLKEYARKSHGIANAVQLQAFIEARLGVIVTVQALRALLRSQPPAPRREMIQMLCDAFECSSDRFYVLVPDKARAERWAKDRSEGKEAMPLYQVRRVDSIDGTVTAPDESIGVEYSEKAKSLCTTFSDPRTFYKKKLKSKEKASE